jgi:hypothetical protein
VLSIASIAVGVAWRGRTSASQGKGGQVLIARRVTGEKLQELSVALTTAPENDPQCILQEISGVWFTLESGIASTELLSSKPHRKVVVPDRLTPEKCRSGQSKFHLKHHQFICLNPIASMTPPRGTFNCETVLATADVGPQRVPGSARIRADVHSPHGVYQAPSRRSSPRRDHLERPHLDLSPRKSG